jgi:large subunit ribosomal protein L22
MKESYSIATLRYLKIAPRKVRIVADMIRGLSLKEAQAQLMLSPRRPSGDLLKLIHSARANAVFKKIDPDTLYIKEIRVDQGPKQKRWMPRARGSSAIIERKTSHVSVVLGVAEKVKRVAYIISEKPKKKVSEKKEKKTSGKKKKEEIVSGSGKKTSEPTGFRKVFRRKSI